MPTASEALNTAIAELHCIDPERAPSLQDLHALSVAGACIDALLVNYVALIRATPGASNSWAEIATAIGAPSHDAVRQRYRTDPARDLVAAFWSSHAERFSWSFLPSAFLVALYGAWMRREHPGAVLLAPGAFTRRLTPVATASGGWVHTRARTRVASATTEPLAADLPWRPDVSGKAVWGLLRTTA